MLNAKVGSFAGGTATGNQAITGVGFQPELVIFFTTPNTGDAATGADSGFGLGAGVLSSDQRAFGFGVDDGVSSFSDESGTYQISSACVRVTTADLTVAREADFVSHDADGFTINWTTASATQHIINYLALGGDTTNLKTGSLTTGTATGNKAITGVGFQPDLVIFFSSRATADEQSGAAELGSGVGFATSSSARGYTSVGHDFVNPNYQVAKVQKTDKCFGSVDAGSSNTQLYEADFVSMDSDGFTVNITTAPSTERYVHYVAIKGGQYKVGSFNQGTATGNQAITGVGFQPNGIMFLTFCAVTNSGIDADDCEISFGAATSSSARGHIFFGSDEGGTAQTGFVLNRTKCIGTYVQDSDAPNTSTLADFVSNDADGFTVNNTTADATSREILYLAFGDAAAGGTAYAQECTAALVISDVLSRYPQRPVLESVVLVDTANKSTSRTVTDQVVLNDVLETLKAIFKELIEAVALNDAVVRFVGAVRTEAITLTDTLVRNTQRILSETITFTDNMVKTISRTLTQEIVLSDLLTASKLTLKELVEALVLDDTLTRAVGKLASETVTLTDSIVRSITRTLNETLTLLDNTYKTIQRILSETLVLTGTFLGEITTLIAQSIGNFVIYSVYRAMHTLQKAARNLTLYATQKNHTLIDKPKAQTLYTKGRTNTLNTG